jgi:DUF4097 and DUF4098 domain-containing protein YvlB
MSVRALTCAFVFLLPLLLGGCVVSAVDDSYESRQVEAEVAFDPLSFVTIEGDNGDVTVRRTDTPSARVRADIRGRGQARIAGVQVIMQTNAAGDLSIRVDWPIGWRHAGEAAVLDIELPGCSGITINTGNGGISLTGLGGRAVLASGNGEISVADHSGDVEISTSNGYVEADQVSGGCRIRTSNGEVAIRDVGGRVSIATTNGPVEVRLSEENPGPLDVRTANGGVEIEIGSGFTGDLRLETFNGRVRVVGVSGEIEVDDEREWAVIHRGGSDNRSLVRTSNGRIEVRQR